MNIFYLSDDITECARYHCDKHVVKMILESAQMLCTVLHGCGMDAPYKATHSHHPCVLWLNKSLDNWLWLQSLAAALNDEYQYRFDHDKPHKSSVIAQSLPLPRLPKIGITERPQVMPDQYKVPGDTVTAYRQFYAVEKKHLLKYSKRPVPEWVNMDA